MPAKLVAKAIATPPANCAEFLTCALTRPQEEEGHGLFFDNKGNSVKDKKFVSADQEQAIWDHTISIIDG